MFAPGETPAFRPGQRVRVADHAPVGHYRVPTYLRGKVGMVEAVVEPAAVDNEAEAYGRNAGCERHYFRVRFAMTEIWSNYAGFDRDTLHVEIFESWLGSA